MAQCHKRAFVQHLRASSGHPTPTPRCLSGRHEPAIPIQGPEYLSGHRRRDRRLRFAMTWRVMTIAPPMAAATAKPATPERTMARCPSTTPRKPESVAVIAKPVIEKNPAFRSRHSHLVYPFIVSLQLVRDARDIAVGGWRGAMKPLGTQAFHPFSLPGHCSPRFPACGLNSASLYLCLWQCPRRAGPDGLESGFRTTAASNPAWACAGRGSGRRQPMVRSRARRRASGYYGGRATLGAAQRCRRRPGPGGSAAPPTFPHAGC